MPPVNGDRRDVELLSQSDFNDVLIDDQRAAGAQLTALRFDPDREIELGRAGERRAGHCRRGGGKNPTRRHSGCGGNFATSSTMSGPRFTFSGSHVPGAWR